MGARTFFTPLAGSACGKANGTFGEQRRKARGQLGFPPNQWGGVFGGKTFERTNISEVFVKLLRDFGAKGVAWFYWPNKTMGMGIRTGKRKAMRGHHKLRPTVQRS